MKQLFSTLCILSLIISGSSFTMDFDAEKDFSLEDIHRKITEKPTTRTKTEIVIAQKQPTQSLSEKFNEFERKIVEEFGNPNAPQRKPLNPYLYFQRVQRDIPEIISNQLLISAYSDKENTLFHNAITEVEHDFLNRYNKVTSDTLSNIENTPELPAEVKAYAINRIISNLPPYKCVDFPKDYRYIDFRSNTDLAIIANHNSFQVWDLTTGEISFLPKKARLGLIKFSADGLNIITVTLHQEEPRKIVHIDIWDSFTKKITHTIEHPSLVSRIALKQNPTADKTLWIFDKQCVSLYTINEGSPAILSNQIATDIKEFHEDLHPREHGHYELSGCTLWKKSLPHFLCFKAIQNTTNKEVLQQIRTAPTYQKLTLIEKNYIEQDLIEKTEELMRNENSIFKSLFG